uniref:Condensin complex subunit 1 n=1 Tax=Heterorhabditis bacteriophora TaxID=37862 RepID=A0A1I7XKL7_HETBA
MTRRRCQQKSVPDSAIVEHMDTDNNDNIDVISGVPMTEVVKGKSDIPKKRGKRKNTGVKDEDNKEQQLEYYLSDYPVLIQKATVNVKGQKTLIKRLWSDHEEVVEKCAINDLRRALWEPTFISCPEDSFILYLLSNLYIQWLKDNMFKSRVVGIKLCAYALRKIGIRSAFLLMKKMILGGATNSTCNHLGEVIYSAWKMANKEENEQLKQDIEHEMITGSAHDAIFIPEPFSSKFMHILSAFSNIKTEKAKYDGMLIGLLCFNVQAHNDKIRYAASSILLSFYPLIDDDEFKRVECLEKQHKVLENMLKDDCVMIRTEASKKILRILSLFWTYIPKQFIKNYLTYIIDKLARDNVVGIRLAGIRYLLPVPSCLNASEHALKCIGLNGINDKNERVRIAAFQMLRALKGHRYIRFFDVVSMDDILARLEIEPSESVRKEIVPLIFKSFFPDRDHVDQNERMRRASFLVKQGRICALTFHRLIYPLNLVSVKEAVEHIQFLTILVYRISAKGMSADSTIDTTIGFDDTIATTVTLSGANQEYNVPDENNEVWQRNKVLMECVVVLWMSLRKTTSLVGTTMVIGSMLPQSSMDGITQSVLSLLNEKAVDECVLEPYLEATAQWRIEYLFDIIESGALDSNNL